MTLASWTLRSASSTVQKTMTPIRIWPRVHLKTRETRWHDPQTTTHKPWHDRSMTYRYNALHTNLDMIAENHFAVRKVALCCCIGCIGHFTQEGGWSLLILAFPWLGHDVLFQIRTVVTVMHSTVGIRWISALLVKCISFLLCCPHGSCLGLCLSKAWKAGYKVFSISSKAGCKDNSSLKSPNLWSSSQT